MTDMPSENGNVYYHGSSSASLIGVFDKNSPGLKSTGYLLKEGKVPFCGQLDEGIKEKHVNTRFISATSKEYMKIALDCSNSSVSPWTPEIGKDRIMRYAASKEDYRTSFGANSESVALLDMLLKIENLRMEQWNNLADYEKKAITNPFPVLYEVKNAKGVVHVNSRFTAENIRELYCGPNIGAEVGIPGPVMPADLVIYVPTENMESAKNLARGLQHEPEIRPLSEFENFSPSTQKVSERT